MLARVVVLLCLAALAFPASAAAARSVPPAWLGVMADGPLTGESSAAYEGEWDGIAAAGAETVRTAFYWNEAQPYRTFADVPPPAAARFHDEGGVPTDFSPYDRVVASAARRHLGILPVVHRTPAWEAERPSSLASTPRGTAAFAAFMYALVRRYGPQGTFWAERPELPRMVIHSWQIWNEPNLTGSWTRQPFAPSYVALLKAANRALKAADPRSRTVLAGLPNESFRALRAIYRAGGRGAFDVVALHPYTGRPRGVIRLIELARAEIRRGRDRALPIWVSELSWPASVGKAKGPRGFTTTDRGQASRLREGLGRLAAARRRLRIERVYWYTWLSAPAGPSAFGYSGLRRLEGGRVRSAPALAEYRRAARRLEGCEKAPGDASRCR